MKSALFLGLALSACGRVEHGDAEVNVADASPPPAPTTVACSSTVPATASATTFAAMPRNPGALIGDATNLYFFDADGLEKMPFTGGAKTTLWSGVVDDLWGITVDATNVYWANDAQIVSVPIAGGPQTSISSDPDGGSGLLVSSSRIFWISYSAANVTAIILSAPLSGGAPTPAISNSSSSAASTYDSVSTFTLDAQRLYWAESPGSDIPTTLYEMPLGGGTITNLASTSREVSVQAMAANGVDLFWSEDTAVKKISIDGGSPIILASGFDSIPSGLELDAAGNVYWQLSYTGFFRADSNGICVQELVAEQPNNFSAAFVVGPQQFYFTDDAVQTIDAVPR